MVATLIEAEPRLPLYIPSRREFAFLEAPSQTLKVSMGSNLTREIIIQA